MRIRIDSVSCSTLRKPTVHNSEKQEESTCRPLAATTARTTRDPRSKTPESLHRRKASIAEELVFPSPDGSVLDPDNLIKRYFLPCIEHAGLRRFRFHDMRHTFGSLLIQDGASITYVKEQMGHSSIPVTVDTYGYLIPGANVAWVDSLDSQVAKAETTQQQNATAAQPRETDPDPELGQLIEEIGGGGWTRTNDLGIMRPSL